VHVRGGGGQPSFPRQTGADRENILLFFLFSAFLSDPPNERCVPPANLQQKQKEFKAYPTWNMFLQNHPRRPNPNNYQRLIGIAAGIHAA